MRSFTTVLPVVLFSSMGDWRWPWVRVCMSSACGRAAVGSWDLEQEVMYKNVHKQEKASSPAVLAHEVEASLCARTIRGVPEDCGRCINPQLHKSPRNE